MEKKSILTPVLCVILSVVLLGSGAIALFKGGVFSNDKDKLAKNNNNDQISIEFEGINNALTYVSNNFSKLEKIAKGEIDTGVSAAIGVELTEAAGAGDIGRFDFTVDAKSKGGNQAADYAIKYDGQAIATMNTVFSDDTVYVRIPELNDAYIKGSLNFDELMSSELYDEDVTAAARLAEKTQEIVTDELIEDVFDLLVESVENNIPEGKNAENLTGDIEGIEYDYTQKTYTITYDNFKGAALEFLNGIKTNKDLEEVYNLYINELGAAAEMTQEDADNPSYREMVETLIEEIEASEDDSDDTIDVNIAYNSDNDPCGINIDIYGEAIAIAVVNEKDKCGFEFEIYEDNEKACEFAAALTGSDGAYEGKFIFGVFDSGIYKTASMDLSTDIEVVDEETGAFKGNITVSLDADGEKVFFSIDSDSTADKTVFSFSVGADDEVYVTADLSIVETNASDITLPTGTVYDFENEADLESYQNSCDFEGFEQNAKSILGEDLYYEITGSDGYDEFNYDDYDNYGNYNDYYDLDNYEYDFGTGTAVAS